VLNKFFPIVDTCLSGGRYSPTKLYDAAEMAILATFFRPVFAASRVQRMHSKFVLRPHHVPNYGKHPISDC